MCAFWFPYQVSADRPWPLPQTSRCIEALATATSPIRSQFPVQVQRLVLFTCSSAPVHFLTSQAYDIDFMPSSSSVDRSFHPFLYHRPITFCSPTPKSTMVHEGTQQFLDNLERANGREPTVRLEATAGRLRPAPPAPRVSPEASSSSPSSPSPSSLRSSSWDVAAQNKLLRELLKTGWSFNNLVKGASATVSGGL